MNNLYISSLAFSTYTVEQMLSIAKKNNWPIEFSSGMKYRDDMVDVYLKTDIKRMPHNYFPAPKVAFVLNLASTNEQIRAKSINHCKYGLWLARQSKSPFFSAHAGFCIDPDPAELGNKIKYENRFKKAENNMLFIDSLKEILKEAERLDVDFIIENNVIAIFNLKKNMNPLLCCESSEIIEIFNKVQSSRLGLLLDTGHLKVSCKTLGLNLIDEFIRLAECIKGIHHNDNDGLLDSNGEITGDYWLLPFLKKFDNIPQVLEVKKIDETQIFRQIKLLTNGC